MSSNLGGSCDLFPVTSLGEADYGWFGGNHSLNSHGVAIDCFYWSRRLNISHPHSSHYTTSLGLWTTVESRHEDGVA